MFFHACRIAPREQLIALHPGLRIDIESIHRILRRLFFPVIKVTPRAQHLMPIRVRHHRKHLRLRHAHRNLRAPYSDRLSATLQPSRGPCMLPQIVVHCCEVRRCIAIAAVVIKHRQLTRRRNIQQQPVHNSQICPIENVGQCAIRQRHAPDRERIPVRRPLRGVAIRRDHQRLVILHADLSDRRPLLLLKRARHPVHNILVVRRVVINPSKAVRSLRSTRTNPNRHRRQNDSPPENTTHVFQATRSFQEILTELRRQLELRFGKNDCHVDRSGGTCSCPSSTQSPIPPVPQTKPIPAATPPNNDDCHPERSRGTRSCSSAFSSAINTVPESTPAAAKKYSPLRNSPDPCKLESPGGRFRE